MNGDNSLKHIFISYMFDRKYNVKIYLGGQGVPIVEFFVYASHVVVEEHTITIDGVKMVYGENCYIVAD